ncbi:class I SAM-dependent methyltransferase [Heliorestis convoluta]|uniref:SAM-dependent methyltransferase, putative n=1 Tax=Heliorestis convoluta TaxID=356322 RepID=A0A5Q2N4U5_9FIRM|nr:SAM-dependent methyltransferase [Heliorestis convoluta]QGG49331.1 SAM-dependent methyltransferase, putative [Heliorestis convoluta]
MMRHHQLQEYLKAQMKNGPITFRDFMDITLYHRDFGYYTADRSPLGREGDFITSPEVSPLFGQLLARQIEEMWRLLRCPSPFSIVELGPGRGVMAHSILEALQSSELAEHLIYHLVEVSAQRKEEQQKRLSELIAYKSYDLPVSASKGSYGWSKPDQLPENIEGLFLSNEFFDALPVHRLVQRESGLQELYVTSQKDTFAWQEGALSQESLASWVDQHISQRGIALEEGQIIEINPSIGDWLTWIDRHLHCGFLLTIDYGHPAEVLYHPSRREGTLMTYFQHQANSNPFEEVGLKDLTTHVDFTALHTLGQERGWRTVGLTNQMWFLISLLDPEEMKPRATMTVDDFRRQQQLKKLIQPWGMGETFRILIQTKAVTVQELLGLRQRGREAFPL